MEEVCFDDIYPQYKVYVYNICARYFDRSEDIQEASQEVWLSVFCNLKSFRGEAKVASWLYRISCNTAIIILRKKENVLRRHSLSLDSEEDGYLLLHRVNQTGLLDRIYSREVLDKLSHDLDSHQQELLIRKYYYGETQRELAKIYAQPIGTIKGHINRASKKARSSFRNCLSEV